MENTDQPEPQQQHQHHPGVVVLPRSSSIPRVSSVVRSVSIKRIAPVSSSTFTLNKLGYMCCCLSGLAYASVMVIILTSDCPFNDNVGYIFTFTVIAFLADMFMVATYSFHKMDKFDAWAQLLVFVFCGSIALVWFGMIFAAINGLCNPLPYKKGGIFVTKHLVNYIIWILSIMGAVLQLATHFCLESN